MRENFTIVVAVVHILAYSGLVVALSTAGCVILNITDFLPTLALMTVFIGVLLIGCIIFLLIET